MRVLLTGGTGFVGGAICQALRSAGHGVTVVSRHPGPGSFATIGWDGVAAAMRECDAVVNLAGEPIAARRWSPTQKALIHDSRLEATRLVVEAVAAAPTRPRVLVSASAVGYYGPHDDAPLDETAPPGRDFLATVCHAWESEAMRATALGLRVVTLRLGIVLGAGGGALARMIPPFKAFVGGPLGPGRQWMSWIHRDDVTGLVVDTLADETYAGPVNATAPQPVTNAAFTAALGAALMRPTLMRVPAVVLRLALGEVSTMLLTGQRVLPAVAQAHGYRFRYPEVGAALRVCVRR